MEKIADKSWRPKEKIVIVITKDEENDYYYRYLISHFLSHKELITDRITEKLDAEPRKLIEESRRHAKYNDCNH